MALMGSKLPYAVGRGPANTLGPDYVRRLRAHGPGSLPRREPFLTQHTKAIDIGERESDPFLDCGGGGKASAEDRG
jgi:hypothetical protein